MYSTVHRCPDRGRKMERRKPDMVCRVYVCVYASGGGPRRIANWSDSKNAMHRAKKCQKVPL